MKTFLFLLLSCVSCFGQGFSLTGNAFAHLTVRPPNLWVDVQQYGNGGDDGAGGSIPQAPHGFIVTNMLDFSGHGFYFTNQSGSPGGGPTNVHYVRDFGGAFTATNSALDMRTIEQQSAYGGKGIQLMTIRSNQCTIGMRIRCRDDNTSAIIQTSANPPTGDYGAFQITVVGVSTLFWDFGLGFPNSRIQKAKPAGFNGSWVNIFCTRSRTNMDIWMSGPDGNLTNFVSGMGQGLAHTNNTTTFYLLQLPGITNYLAKRFIVWDYQLPESDMKMWNRHMSYLP